ncbi:MAG: serine/threonine protein kinase [Polyangiales bacterium]
MTALPQQTDETFNEIGGYAIVEKLREGGMATLYLGTRGGAHGFSRPVAIKVMHDHVAAQPRMTQMFVDEALLGSHLQHPNIGHIEEFGEEAGRYFLVMEYIDGCSVSDFRRHHRVEQEAMKPLTAAYIISQAAKGLHHAHGATDAAGEPLDIVHRDVSPGNVLVSRSGHVKVIDFGVAQSELRSQHTVASLKGKFRYMSPEQARGKDLDPRSDVYCLGLILWELLSNRRAIQGKSDLQLLESARAPELEPVSNFADVSEELASVVQKAIAVDPEERWATALEFSQAIRAAIPAVQDFDPSEIGAMAQIMPRGGRSHVTLASSSELSKSLLSRSQSRSELRPREDLIPEVDIEDPEGEKKRRLILGALIVFAVAIFLLFAIPSEQDTNPALEAQGNSAPSEASSAVAAPQPATPEEREASAEPTMVVEPFEAAEPEAAQVPAARGASAAVAPSVAPTPASARPANSETTTGSRTRRAARAEASASPDTDTRVPDAERSVRTRGDSQPEHVGGILLDTGGEDDTRLRPAGRSSGAVRAGGTLLAE